MGVKWAFLPPEEQNRIAHEYQAGHDVKPVAEKYGMQMRSLLRNVQQYLYYERQFAKQVATNIQLPPFPSKQYLDYEELTGDDFIIISDIEIPDHNPDYLKLALLTGMAHGIKRLIIAGDLIATDQDGLNSWVSTWQHRGELTYEDSIDLVSALLLQFEKWFTEIVLIEGNHDDRVARATKGQVHLGMFLKETSVRYSRYEYLWLNTSRGPVKVVHPSAHFSSDPVVLGQQLYNVEPRKSHYVIAHCHRQQSGWSPDGSFEIHALGTGRDDTKTKYKATKASKHKQWDSSFLMINEGYFTDLSLKGTNWRRFLGDFYQENRSEQIRTEFKLAV